MNCPACGGDCREGANFCRHCGAPLVTVQPQLPEGTPIGAAAPAEQDLAASEDSVPELTVREAEPLAALPGPAEEAPAGSEAQLVPSREGDASAAYAEAESTAQAMLAPPESTGEQTGEGAVHIGGLESLPESAASEVGAVASVEEGQVAEPLAPLPPGTVLAGRYVLIEADSVQASEIVYLARDLCRCSRCGFAGNAPDDAFCLQCGASMDRRPTIRLLQVRDTQTEPASGEMAAERLTQDGKVFLLLPGAQPRQQPSVAGQTLRLIAGQRSDPGQLRELNEDSLLAMTWIRTSESQSWPVVGLYAIADGMGGHEGGEVASKMALQVMADQVVQTFLLPELAGASLPEQDLLVCLAKAVEAANDALYLARCKRENDMGTTLTVALIRADRLFLAHVGDSRAYRWNTEGLTQLTSDHSMIASMVASGRAAPEEIYTHPQRSVIYRCIGDTPIVQVDTSVLPLVSGDRLVLCSDGLWELIRSEGIADVLMQEADPQVACDLLVQRANAAGGDDNISVIVVCAQSYQEEFHGQ